MHLDKQILAGLVVGLGLAGTWPIVLLAQDRSTSEDVAAIVAGGPVDAGADSARIYTSTGKAPSGSRFAGGSSCCNCRTEHSGVLPDEFPMAKVSAVTFYLTGSQAQSYYTRQKAGPTRLQLILGESQSLATSAPLETPSSDPVPHKWLLRFAFEPAVEVGPGIPWKLEDGDNQKYSAVILHASTEDSPDNRDNALAGQGRTFGCKYARVDPMWYSAKFEFIGEQPEPVPEPEPPAPVPEPEPEPLPQPEPTPSPPEPAPTPKRTIPEPMPEPAPPAPKLQLPQTASGDENPSIAWSMEGGEFRLLLEWESPGTPQTLQISEAYVEEGYLYIVAQTSCDDCVVHLERKQADQWQQLDSIPAYADTPLSLRGELADQ